MKSLFLFFLVLSHLCASPVWAQSKTKKKLAGPAVSAKKEQKVEVVSKTEIVSPKRPVDRFLDRLRISYFGAFTSPNGDDIVKGNFRNGATYPETAQNGKGANHYKNQNQDSWPMNMWNQISFNYNFGAKMNFVINPRFMIPLGHATDMGPTEDISAIMLDDFLVGFQGVVYTSPDKKFNLWIRPGIRLPTSRTSRSGRNANLGRISQQNELAYQPTYDFNKTWQLGVFGQFRQWMFNDRISYARFRFYTAPYVQYTMNDTTRIQVYYETYIENNKRWKSVNGKKPSFKDLGQDLMIGVNHDVNAKLNIFPFLGVYADDSHFGLQSLWIGAWVSYQIK